MRIGLLTLWGDFNYGNRFQNYAIQTMLERMGEEPVTIVPLESVCMNILRWMYRFSRFPFDRWRIIRKLNLRQFNVRKIKTRVVYAPRRKLPRRLSDQFDAFITGSDQVWNPELVHFRYDYFFLRFTEDQKKICLSPSLGVSRIASAQEASFRTALAGFHRLSCREEAGAAEIERLTGRKCETLIDPVLALAAEEWRSMEDRSMVPQEPYVLRFFLGNGNRASDYATRLLGEKFALVDAGDAKSRYFACTPERLLALIDSARTVLTDSFHATALSLLFNTPFFVFDRSDFTDSPNTRMNSRIASLTGKFHLQDRYITDETAVPLNDVCDFTDANATLEKEREKFFSYLSGCLQDLRVRT